MTNERPLVAEAMVPVPVPLPPPRWHGRWGRVIAFQAGMIGVLVVRPHGSAPEAPPAAAVAPAPLVVAAPVAVVAPAPPPARAAPAKRPSAPRRAAPVAMAPDQLVEVELVSNPPGATVRFGDQIGGTTPLSAYLPSTTTTIHFALDGYADYATRWSPRVGRRITATLKPAI